MGKMPAVDFDNLFLQFKDCKVLVIGDVMLDTYWWGKVERISPEAPVPVVTLTSKDYRLGGAANVALNLTSLGAQVATFSVIGNDHDGKLLKTRFAQEGLETSWLFESKERITTNKSRIMSRNQQMLRLDAEITSDLNAHDEQLLLESFAAVVDDEKPHVVIFEDYNKGVLTRNVISSVIEICRQRSMISAVDPKRQNFFSYEGVSIFKPNLKEVREALNLPSDKVDKGFLTHVHNQLQQQLHHDISLITLSEKGIFYHDQTRSAIVPS
ncbi:MAG TPA: PfkB family carbohydrate kinase, partial [Chitinophagaceae bacterium]|nr:PfkB family carbohydrate kinase [Chitinophagaceae bacterium]